ncbi:MAG: bifunctional helix-turn-helix domain-containing protein/methylated-DNA--[protein]-cysteine S-methyltransferase [Deferribacteres bacterium]|nr:bifunctional helix-turn-helix domain-containing protein/methylated-DNA--[protein]-cysteine S-methyltransferase [candidate division KSB1 bacterium]MCB9512164.1 bifunctional helix-turn-helix domain-containing protein/methylated-DNA--[protein]-cysteine S-methyltransferase [Deferribacteres bacterium]
MEEKYQQATQDYQRIERAINLLEMNFKAHPPLKDIAASVAMSEFHFQRLFSRWVGISPKRFLQFLTVEYAKQQLEKSSNLLDVTFESGLSSPGRLHDLFVSCEAITPGDYKAKGAGLRLEYGFVPSPFGDCLLIKTEKGICGLAFVQNNDPVGTLKTYQMRWNRAQFVENRETIEPLAEQIFFPDDHASPTPLHLHVRGTNFQIKVWNALLRIPMGALTTYNSLASALGAPRASRAVGTAVGQNPISFLIPCHRVLRKNAHISGYAWGPNRKRIMLGWEAAQSNSAIGG